MCIRDSTSPVEMSIPAIRLTNSSVTVCNDDSICPANWVSDWLMPLAFNGLISLTWDSMVANFSFKLVLIWDTRLLNRLAIPDSCLASSSKDTGWRLLVSGVRLARDWFSSVVVDSIPVRNSSWSRVISPWIPLPLKVAWLISVCNCSNLPLSVDATSVSWLPVEGLAHSAGR